MSPTPKPSREQYSKVAAAKIDHLLGAMPDPEIAKIVGCKREAVGKRRRAMGIGPCKDYARIVPIAKPREIAPEFAAMIGTMPDPDVATLAGVSVQMIRRARNRMGRAAWVPEKAPEEAAVARVKPAPKPKPAPAVKTPVAPRPAPAPSMSVKRQLREPEEEPAPGIRPEVVAPTPVSDLSLFTTRELAIIRAVRTGKPMTWILDTFRGVSEGEVNELVEEAGR